MSFNLLRTHCASVNLLASKDQHCHRVANSAKPSLMLDAVLDGLDQVDTVCSGYLSDSLLLGTSDVAIVVSIARWPALY